MDQHNIEPLAQERSISRQRETHRCPHCPKQYTTPKWLDNHIKIQHTTRGGRGRPGILTDIGVQLSQSPPESHSSALVADLEKLSSSLRQFTSLIDDIVPRLREFGEGSSRSCSIDRSHPQNLKRRASSPDLREREGLSRTGISAYSAGGSVPQASEPVRGGEPRPQNIGPITTSFDDRPCKTNESDYPPSVAPYNSTRHAQMSRLLPPQENAPSSPIIGSELPQRQLHGESSQGPSLREQANDAKPFEQVSVYQHESLPTRHELALTLPNTTQLLPDAQPLQSCNMSLPKPNQHNPTLQTLKSYSDSFPLEPQFGDVFDGILQECRFSSDSLIADSSDAFDISGQVEGTPMKEDDLFSGTSEYMNWLSTLSKGTTPYFLANTIHRC